jgi:HEAT repeat protein
MLRRAVLLLMVAICGLLAGVIAWPILRTTWYIRQARSEESEPRVAAINALGGLCAQEPANADAAIGFVKAVLAETDVGSPETRAVVDRIAVWTIERSDRVAAVFAGRFDDADDAQALHIADLLRQAGRWTPPQRSWSQLVRREAIRTRSEDPNARISAMQWLSAYGPAVARLAGDLVSAGLTDDDATVRIAAVRAATSCLDPSHTRALLLQAGTDTEAAVRREAILQSALAGFLLPVWPLTDVDPRVREAAAWACGFHGETSQRPALLRLAAEDPDPGVAAMAAWAAGWDAADSAELPDRWLARMTASLDDDAAPPDRVLAARMMVALGRRGRSDAIVDVVPLLSPSASGDVANAATYACGRVPATSIHRETVIRVVQRVIENAVQSGHGSLSAAGCEAASALGDPRFVPLLRGIAGAAEGQPMLRYAAAVSLLELDRDAGLRALIRLLDSEADAVCDLSAIRLGRLSDPPRARLVLKLIDGTERTRASAALALGFAGASDIDVRGEPFDEFLRRRTDPDSDVHEHAWKLHGYYLCARLILAAKEQAERSALPGQADVRQRLDVFIRNVNFPRVGLYAALLEAGDPLPMDLLLRRESTIDLESLLRDARFIETIRHAYPAAPTFEWFEDRPLRQWQTDRLREWWALHEVRRVPG